ncbi:MAG: hypothetical protein WAX79_04545, partial [Candidatus Omnitrophota bacterium]
CTMCKDYGDLRFMHFVIDDSDGTIFAAARINGNGKTANFLVNGTVKQQAGPNWLELAPEVARIIRERVHAAQALGCIPTYRTGKLPA